MGNMTDEWPTEIALLVFAAMQGESWERDSTVLDRSSVILSPNSRRTGYSYSESIFFR